MTGDPKGSVHRDWPDRDTEVPAGLDVRAGSIVRAGALWAALAGPHDNEQLLVAAGPDAVIPAAFAGEQSQHSEGTLLVGPRTEANARALRSTFPVLRPRLLGPRASFGFGDRLGLATPGHAAALGATGSDLLPAFAQQSIREMTRCGRSPDDVLADATWGVLRSGWRDGYGADADHIKTESAIDACAAAGFTMFTLDPGDEVADEADAAPAADITRRFASLPWPELETSAGTFLGTYAGRRFDLDGQWLAVDDEAARRVAVKMAAAIVHATRLYRHLASLGIPHEVEISIDEAGTATGHLGHLVMARELARLGVRFDGLAPRYAGRFEKGIEYLGDLEALRADIEGHAAIARTCGPYKLGMHSGSDKFAVYPLFAEAARPLLHLKTCGTSYLEGIRTVARFEPSLFREILAVASAQFARDRATYDLTTDPGRIPDHRAWADERLPELVDLRDSRQVLHVTFGSVIVAFGSRIRAVLVSHADEHEQALASHFRRHLEPLSATGGPRQGR